MVLVLLVAVQTTEVALEAETPARTALEGRIRSVLFMRVFARAGCPPCVNVETLPPRQPPLPQLLGSSRNERELLAGALLTASLLLFALDLQVMVCKQMPTKALRL